MALHAHSKVFQPPESLNSDKINLVGLSKNDLADLFQTHLSLPSYRAKQAWHWIYKKGVSDLTKMTNFNKSLCQDLSEKFCVSLPEISVRQISDDGTRKWLLKLVDGHEIEAVYIPESKRGTLCVSSQVGCTLTCKFCHTGTQRLVRNLSAAEIVAQLMVARNELNDWTTDSEKRQITNIVMMGMGEPLYNYDNVSEALKIIMDQEGLSLTKKRITLSTSGVVPLIEKCGEELGVKLALSLHAVDDKTRDMLVPLNKKYPIKDVLNACKNYPGTRNAKRITFEYVMLEGVNDSVEEAKKLVSLLKQIPAKINLIPFNPWPGSFFKCSSNNQINRFAKVLMDAGYASPIRTPRGRDISAACGQLKTESVRLKKSLREAS